MFWYLFQLRELKRFFQQQEAEFLKDKAVMKEVDLTNVLNLQQNAVIIYSQVESDTDNALNDGFPNIEFANNKSSELFKINLETLSARACLNR